MVVQSFFFFQAEDGIRDLVRSRGLGDVYKRQQHGTGRLAEDVAEEYAAQKRHAPHSRRRDPVGCTLSLIHI